MTKPKYKYYYKNQLIAESSRDSYRYALVREDEDGKIVKYSLSSNIQTLERYRKEFIESCNWFAYEYYLRTPESVEREKRRLELIKTSKIVELEIR
jgi:hypothetical protein